MPEQITKPGIYFRKSSGWDENGWTSVPNQLLRDKTLSWDCKGAAGWIASHRETFRMTGEDLASAGPKGRDHARKMLRELEERGWLTRERLRNPESGRFDIHVWTIHPAPVPVEERTALAA